jgi:ABC-2 type transport system permease protein
MKMLNTRFLNKEINEYVKTPKLLIVMSLFIFFAILSPLTARYMNELLSLLAEDVQITFPEPTFGDAWLQFYKNTTSLCLIVFMIIMTGTVAQEKNKGSIMLVLTKKVSRFNFLISKFAGGALLVTIGLLASLLVSGLYTQILFKEVVYDGLLISIILIWLMSLFYTALAILASVIAKTPTIAALLGFVGYAFFNLLNVSTGLQKFNPAGASSIVNNIIYNTSSTSTNIICLISTIIGTVLIFLLSYIIFKKQEI